ncbi:MAG: CopG family transcriptional regulator [Bryobacterales bacterium]|nr:ribbon-helix-helix domain-containing protein [Bryobacteraceae bacterium]MDW8353615.1 CopG family transcriptional regulator [Bryobacterales bacterium]
MVRTTVYLPSELTVALRRLAEATGRSRADLIREALVQYVQRAQVPPPVRFGRYRSGRSDISERARELLRKAARSRRWPRMLTPGRLTL